MAAVISKVFKTCEVRFDQKLFKQYKGLCFRRPQRHGVGSESVAERMHPVGVTYTTEWDVSDMIKLPGYCQELHFNLPTVHFWNGEVVSFNVYAGSRSVSVKLHGKQIDLLDTLDFCPDFEPDERALYVEAICRLIASAQPCKGYKVKDVQKKVYNKSSRKWMCIRFKGFLEEEEWSYDIDIQGSKEIRQRSIKCCGIISESNKVCKQCLLNYDNNTKLLTAQLNGDSEAAVYFMSNDRSENNLFTSSGYPENQKQTYTTVDNVLIPSSSNKLQIYEDQKVSTKL